MDLDIVSKFTLLIKKNLVCYVCCARFLVEPWELSRDFQFSRCVKPRGDFEGSFIFIQEMRFYNCFTKFHQ